MCALIKNKFMYNIIKGNFVSWLEYHQEAVVHGDSQLFRSTPYHYRKSSGHRQREEM